MSVTPFKFFLFENNFPHDTACPETNLNVVPVETVDVTIKVVFRKPKS